MKSIGFDNSNSNSDQGASSNKNEMFQSFSKLEIDEVDEMERDSINSNNQTSKSGNQYSTSSLKSSQEKFKPKTILIMHCENIQGRVISDENRIYSANNNILIEGIRIFSPRCFDQEKENLDLKNIYNTIYFIMKGVHKSNIEYNLHLEAFYNFLKENSLGNIQRFFEISNKGNYSELDEFFDLSSKNYLHFPENIREGFINSNSNQKSIYFDNIEKWIFYSQEYIDMILMKRVFKDFLQDYSPIFLAECLIELSNKNSTNNPVKISPIFNLQFNFTKLKEKEIKENLEDNLEKSANENNNEINLSVKPISIGFASKDLAALMNFFETISNKDKAFEENVNFLKNALKSHTLEDVFEKNREKLIDKKIKIHFDKISIWMFEDSDILDIDSELRISLDNILIRNEKLNDLVTNGKYYDFTLISIDKVLVKMFTHPNNKVIKSLIEHDFLETSIKILMMKSKFNHLHLNTLKVFVNLESLKMGLTDNVFSLIYFIEEFKRIKKSMKRKEGKSPYSFNSPTVTSQILLDQLKEFNKEHYRAQSNSIKSFCKHCILMYKKSTFLSHIVIGDLEDYSSSENLEPEFVILRNCFASQETVEKGFSLSFRLFQNNLQKNQIILDYRIPLIIASYDVGFFKKNFSLITSRHSNYNNLVHSNRNSLMELIPLWGIEESVLNFIGDNHYMLCNFVDTKIAEKENEGDDIFSSNEESELFILFYRREILKKDVMAEIDKSIGDNFLKNNTFFGIKSLNLAFFKSDSTLLFPIFFQNLNYIKKSINKFFREVPQINSQEIKPNSNKIYFSFLKQIFRRETFLLIFGEIRLKFFIKQKSNAFVMINLEQVELANTHTVIQGKTNILKASKIRFNFSEYSWIDILSPSIIHGKSSIDLKLNKISLVLNGKEILDSPDRLRVNSDHHMEAIQIKFMIAKDLRADRNDLSIEVFPLKLRISSQDLMELAINIYPLIHLFKHQVAQFRHLFSNFFIEESKKNLTSPLAVEIKKKPNSNQALKTLVVIKRITLILKKDSMEFFKLIIDQCTMNWNIGTFHSKISKVSLCPMKPVNMITKSTQMLQFPNLINDIGSKEQEKFYVWIMKTSDNKTLIQIYNMKFFIINRYMRELELFQEELSRSLNNLGNQMKEKVKKASIFDEPQELKMSHRINKSQIQIDLFNSKFVMPRSSQERKSIIVSVHRGIIIQRQQIFQVRVPSREEVDPNSNVFSTKFKNVNGMFMKLNLSDINVDYGMELSKESIASVKEAIIEIKVPAKTFKKISRSFTLKNLMKAELNKLKLFTLNQLNLDIIKDHSKNNLQEKSPIFEFPPPKKNYISMLVDISSFFMSSSQQNFTKVKESQEKERMLKKMKATKVLNRI